MNNHSKLFLVLLHLDNLRNFHFHNLFYNQHLLREHEGYVEVEPIFVAKLDIEYGGYKLSDFAM